MKNPSDRLRPQAPVRDRALGLLARREHSALELKAKLARRGYAADEATAAIDRLKDQNHQSDERFAASLARRRAEQGYGPRRIAAELKSHGVGDAEIAIAIAAAGCDWCDLARRQLQRHYGRAAVKDPRERARRAAFLLRRGFDAATVGALVRADVGDPGDGFD